MTKDSCLLGKNSARTFQLPTSLATGEMSVGSNQGGSGWAPLSSLHLIIEFPVEENETL